MSPVQLLDSACHSRDTRFAHRLLVGPLLVARMQTRPELAKEIAMTRWAVATASTVREERAERAAVQAEIAGGRRVGGAEPAALWARDSVLEERIRGGIWFGGASGAGSGRVVRACELHPGSTAGRCVVRRRGGELFAVVVQAGCSRLVGLGWEESVRFVADALLFALRGMTRSGPTMTTP
jgi:hypothetical protein